MYVNSIVLFMLSMMFMLPADGVSGKNTPSFSCPDWHHNEKRIRELEFNLVEEVNNIRKKHKLPRLHRSNLLDKVAKKHSQNMAIHQFFRHVDPSGKGPLLRLHASGFYAFDRVSENIFKTTTYKSRAYEDGRLFHATCYSVAEVARLTVRKWYGSPGHRKNILDSVMDKTGVGVFVSDKTEEIFVTQIYVHTVQCGYLNGPCCEYEHPRKSWGCLVPLVCIEGTCIQP